MKKRLIYEAPEAELILVRFEDNFLQSPGGNQDNQRTLNYSNDGGAGTITSHQNYNDDAF